MFFQEKFHIKFSEQEKIVRLSIRSSEERIDEFFLDKKSVYKFCITFNENSEWFGERKIQGKIIGQESFLRINIHKNIRYTYKMNLSDLRLLHSKLNMMFYDISNLTIDEEDTNIEEQIKSTSQSNLKSNNDEMLENILEELNCLRSKINELENRKPIEKITETIIEKQIVSEQSVFKDNFEIDNDMPIFIPSKIKTNNLKGNINTQNEDNDFNIDTSLEKLNKGEK